MPLSCGGGSFERLFQVVYPPCLSVLLTCSHWLEIVGILLDERQIVTDGIQVRGVVEVDIILVRHALNRDDKSETC